jgi:Protein of unknown function (DUF3489)
MTSVVTSKRPKLTRRMAREPRPDQTAGPVPLSASTLAGKRQTKAALVLDMLAREEGVSLEELCQATSWQAHTSRAFLTGLRKKGRVLDRSKRDDGTTFYRMRADTAVDPHMSAGAGA